MALSLGQQAPDFTLPGVIHPAFRLKELRGQPLILYFYPKDFTGQCTAEACSFRDHFAEFEGLSVQVIGISSDDLATHRRFRVQFGLPFELLSDSDGKVARLYKARVPFLNFTRRITYLLDAKHTIRAVHENLLDGSSHIHRMVEALRREPDFLQPAQPGSDS